MTKVQKLQLRQSEIRSALSAELDLDAAEREDGKLERLTKEAQTLEVELRAALVLESEESTPERVESHEDHQLTELRNRVDFGAYVTAAIVGGGVQNGAEAELNAELGLQGDQFPLELLDDGPGIETRAKQDGESNVNQGTWLDRVFAGTAASRVGITMRSVSPGVASYPVTTQGGGAVQRGRQQAVTESTYNFAITEIKPTRASVQASYTVEDSARLPGLADAIRRDMRMGMVEAVDRKVFLGDTGANENTADITGLTTHADVGEITIKQADKVKPAETLAAFVGLVDGVYAMSESDLRIVATVGANTLWASTIANEAAENQTLAGFLRAAGLAWSTRGEIEAATAAGDFGAFIGLGRGINGAGVSAVWSAGQLIRDPYTKAAEGETVLTMHYLWGLELPRPQNFRRLKFVA